VDSTLQALVSIQSRIDVATTSDWSQGRVELELLTEAGTAWVSVLDAKLGQTHRLVPPHSMTQLVREVLARDCVAAETRTIDVAGILELIMSITTEQLGEGHPLDAVADPDPAEIAKNRSGPRPRPLGRLTRYGRQTHDLGRFCRRGFNRRYAWISCPKSAIRTSTTSSAARATRTDRSPWGVSGAPPQEVPG
jgi:hypothetical protein